ncbi:hypothetical protein Sm713_41330 [Streptomyces sp. TS71-3]|nr:hypothetical protein Sm713_41330 [Streptomyces sp. TS71-3]
MCCQAPPGAVPASRMVKSSFWRQVAAGGEPSLASADHHYIRVLRHGAVVTALGVNFLRQASAT